MEKAVRKRNLKFLATFHHQWLWGWYPTFDTSVDAGNPAFSSLIGTINKLKALPSISNPDVDLLPFRNDIDNVVLKFESLIATNLNNKAALTESRETNADNLKQATDVLNSSDFLKSPDEVIQGLLDSSRSLRILELVQSLNNRDFQSLISSYA